MKTRKLKLTTRIFIFIYAVVIIANTILCGMFYSQTSKNLVEQIAEGARGLAVSAAYNVDPKDFIEAQSQGAQSEAFARVDQELSRFLNAEQLKYVYSFAMNDNGEMVFVVDTDQKEATFGEAYDMDELMRTAFCGTAVADSKSSSDEWGTYLSAYSPIFDGDKVIGIVGVDVDYSRVDEELGKLRLFLLGMNAIILLVLLLAIGFICRKLNTGFNALNDKVKELSGTNGDLSKNIELDTGDEFEVIAGNFNAFINQVHGLTCMVGDASRENASTVGDMNQDITTLSANMEECSATSEAVSDNMAVISEQTNELAAQIANTNSFVTEKSRLADQQANYANQQREEAKYIIEELHNQIREAIAQAKSIEQVQEVVRDITDISRQTKILSLNARVEASRAGESGKGFAVVATEIGDLSNQTADSVMEIDEINEKVQGAMLVLNESVEKLNDFMVNNVLSDYEGYANLGIEFGESTKAILEQMRELNDNSAVISERISQINLSVSDISNAISDSANQLEEVSLSSDSISNSMQELLNNSLL